MPDIQVASHRAVSVCKFKPIIALACDFPFNKLKSLVVEQSGRRTRTWTRAQLETTATGIEVTAAALRVRAAAPARPLLFFGGHQLALALASLSTKSHKLKAAPSGTRPLASKMPSKHHWQPPPQGSSYRWLSRCIAPSHGSA